MEETLATIVKNARINAGLSRKQLASLCGTSRQHILNIENGKVKQPRFSILISLANQLNLDLAMLKEKAGYETYTTADMNLGDFIRVSRIKASLSQSKLAKLSGLTPSHIHLIEHNKVKPFISTLSVLAETLNLDLETLMEKANYRKS